MKLFEFDYQKIKISLNIINVDSVRGVEVLEWHTDDTPKSWYFRVVIHGREFDFWFTDKNKAINIRSRLIEAMKEL